MGAVKHRTRRRPGARTRDFRRDPMHASRLASHAPMNALSLNTYLVKEQVAMFKASACFDILDPQTGRVVLLCREENLGYFTKVLRFTDYKRMTPFDISVRTPEGERVVQVKRGATFFRSVVEVFDGQGNCLGKFRQKMLSIGGSFQVLSPNDELLCELRGKWTGWDFTFGLDGVEFGRVTKKWSGIGRELLTTADNYVLTMAPDLAADHPLRKLILGAVMCIDFVLKE